MQVKVYQKLLEFEGLKNNFLKSTFYLHSIEQMILWLSTKQVNGALEKRLTHMPFTHTFTGSNPVRVTIGNPPG